MNSLKYIHLSSMTLYNVRQISMDLVQQVLQGTNPYIEGPSLIWIISFYCLIFLRRKHHAIFISLQKTRTVCISLLKKGSLLIIQSILNGPI